jgi:hypothetical protein
LTNCVILCFSAMSSGRVEQADHNQSHLGEKDQSVGTKPWTWLWEWIAFNSYSSPFSPIIH